MTHAPTFNTTSTGEPCQCLSQRTTSSIPQALLAVIGTLLLVGVGFVMGGITQVPLPASPTTTLAKSLSFATPSPIPSTPSPTPNPLIPPTYPVVVVTTLTPVPTATMTTFETQATAAIQTQVADKVPRACHETTVTPGTPKVCWWETNTPTPIPTPAYQTCSTPIPGAFCRKEN